MADETRTILLELNIDSVKAIKNQKELKEIQKAVNKEFENAKIGTEEYKKLESVSGLLTKRIGGLKDATKQATAELNVQKGSTRDLQAQYNLLAKALRETTPGNDVLGNSFEEARAKALALKTQIKDLNSSIGDNTGNVGNYGNAFKESVGGIQVFGQSLSGLFKMIVANPIGLIITALVGLFNILKRNEQIAVFFEGVMTGLGFAFDKVSGFIADATLESGKFAKENTKLIGTIKEVGTRILNSLLAPITYLIDLMPAASAALEGEFSKATDIAGEASVKFGKSIVFLNDQVPEFVKELGSAVDAGVKYKEALNDIQDAQSALNVELANLTNKRDELKLQSADLARTEEERIALSEKAARIDEEILAKRKAIIQQSIKAEEDHLVAISRTGNEADEVRHKINDLKVQQANAENESLKFQEKAQNKRNAIIEKQLADEEKLTEANRKRFEESRKQNEDQLNRDVNATLKLEQFKRDQAAKNAQGIDERLKAELKAEDFRVKVLLRNENLLASEKEFILADSAVRIEQIKKTSEEKIRAEDKKTADDKKNLLNKQVSEFSNNSNLIAGISQNITQAKLNNESASLESQRQAELQAAGNNAKKQDKINKDYDKRKAAIEKDAAKRQANIQAAMALVNTFTGVTKVIAEYPKFDFGVATAIGVGLTLASGLAQVAAIKSQKFEKGGLPSKSGIIGGKPHSEGGTTFSGTDGSVFEAEAGELLAVVNKRDTPMLSMLSQVNSIHGKPFFRDGGTHYLNDGGFAARASSNSVVDSISISNQIIDAVSSIQFPPVTVEDINAGVGRRTKVVSRANI